MSRKTKYKKSFKEKAVKAVLNEHQSINAVSRAVGVSKSELMKWIQFYQHYGAAGLNARSSNTAYTSEYKLIVIRSIEENGLSYRSASLKYNIPSHSTVRKWYLIYLTGGIEGIDKERRGRNKTMTAKSKKTSRKSLSREEELLKENESLKAELALLKKLHALAQAKKKKQ
jgi:transposase